MGQKTATCPLFSRVPFIRSTDEGRFGQTKPLDGNDHSHFMKRNYSNEIFYLLQLLLPRPPRLTAMSPSRWTTTWSPVTRQPTSHRQRTPPFPLPPNPCL